MAAEIGGRPVLRPADNVAHRPPCVNNRAIMRKVTKPPPSPVKPSSPTPKISPPNSQAPSSPVQLKPALPTSPCKPPSSPSPRKPLNASKSCDPAAIAKIAQHAAHGDCWEAVETLIDARSGSNPRKTAPNSSVAKNPKTINPYMSLTKSTADGFQHETEKSDGKPNPSRRQRSQSLDETSLANILAAKKAAGTELSAQKKLRVAEYGRKKGKASRVAPDVVSPALLAASIELQRCKFITAQTDPLYVAYHDEEWGVPVHDDRMLFELLILAGAQVELSWSTILNKRDVYRVAFCGFDPATVATFNEKYIQSLAADRSLLLPGGKIRGVVENAQRILEIVEQFGSLHKYLWSFINYKPIVNSYRYPKQVPVKTSKSESISKDLVRRGFRFVGPTIIYSLMQAAGMTNDHLLQCFRHPQCQNSPSSSPQASQEKQFPRHEHDCQELSSLPQQVSEEMQEQKQCVWHYDCGIFSDVEQELVQLEKQCSGQESKLEECLSGEYESLSALSQEANQEKQEEKQSVWHYECGIFSLPLEEEAAQQERQYSDEESQVKEQLRPFVHVHVEDQEQQGKGSDDESL